LAHLVKYARNIQENRLRRRAAGRRAEIEGGIALLPEGISFNDDKEIADADLSEGSIYNYFESKEQLFYSLLDKLIELQSTESIYTKTLPADTRSFLDSVFEIQHEFLNSNRELIKAVLPEVIINDVYREKFFHEFYTPAISFFILQFQARDVLGHIQPVNHQMVSRSLVGLIYGYYLLELIDDPIFNEKWESLLGQTTALIYEGLSP
jgi:AcrR family transcriptional regulator